MYSTVLQGASLCLFSCANLLAAWTSTTAASSHPAACSPTQTVTLLPLTQPLSRPLTECSQPDAVERLLVRLLPRPSERNVFTGDVVAFTSPLTVAAAAVAGPGGAAAARLPYGGSSAAAAAAAAAGGIGEELGQSTMVRRVAAMPGDELTTGEEEGAESYIIPEVRPTRWLGYSELSVGGRRARGAYCWAERARLRSPELQSDLLHSATCCFASQSSRFRPLLHNWRPLALLPTLHPHPNPQPLPTPCRGTAGCWPTTSRSRHPMSLTAAALGRCRSHTSWAGAGAGQPLFGAP